MITAEELRSYLIYEPLTGDWFWRVSAGVQRKGSQAGCIDGGYWRIRIHRKNYRAARLAILYMTGKWPSGKVDHKNRNQLDDSWVNLREATSSQNGANSARHADNHSGYKGVDWSPRHKKWRSRIRIHGKLMFIGLYDHARDASVAYYGAAKEYFGEFANAG